MTTSGMRVPPISRSRAATWQRPHNENEVTCKYHAEVARGAKR